MKKTRLILNAVVFCLLIAVIPAVFLIMPDKEMSVSERRPLMSFDEVAKPKDGAHPFEVFESYFLDQFPMRDSFRSLKAFVYMDLFKKNDNNKIYTHNGTVIEIQDELDEKQIANALNVFNKVIDTYFENNKIYYSIIPDKHYYASKENGYPAMDYEKLFETVKKGFENAEYIDISELLELSDYYKTDSHWSQDKITDVADKIVSSMNGGANNEKSEWKVNVLSPFYGVYYGQSALVLSPDEIKYLTNDTIDGMTVSVLKPEFNQSSLGWEIGKTVNHPVYVTEYFNNNDPYDVFLAGPEELIVIENPNASNDKELVIFRDSFGSSIAPLIANGYRKVTLVDLRYAVPDALGNCIEYDENTDVLFLYSTGMYNNGATIRNFTGMKVPDTQPDENDKQETVDDTSENKQPEAETQLDEGGIKEDDSKIEETPSVKEEEPSEDMAEDKDDPIISRPEEEMPAEEQKPTVQTLDNGIMMYDGYAFEKNGLDKAQLDYAIGVMNKISQRYLSESRVYVSVIPDKNYHVMKQAGGDLSEYDTVVSSVRNGVSGAAYIDIMGMLSLSDYYKTDAHWRQENIVDVANKLVSSMNPFAGISESEFTVATVPGFSGTYLKSGKVEMPKEDIKYLADGRINGMTAMALNGAGKAVPMAIYSEGRLANIEEYDLFLGGAQTVVTIENPNASNDKELVVFRDSFGSSIAPLLACGYKKTTLVDTRYIVPDMLPNFVDFANCDVLFLYSANILNRGRILKDFMK